jgi:hypothetical protein
MGAVIYSYNPRRQEDHEFKARLDKIGRLYRINK